MKYTDALSHVDDAIDAYEVDQAYFDEVDDETLDDEWNERQRALHARQYTYEVDDDDHVTKRYYD